MYVVATSRLRNGCNAVCRTLQRTGSTERGENWSRDSQLHARHWPLGCTFVHAAALLGCHTTYVLSRSPTFRNSVAVACSRVKQCVTAWGGAGERERECNFFFLMLNCLVLEMGPICRPETSVRRSPTFSQRCLTSRQNEEGLINSAGEVWNRGYF